MDIDINRLTLDELEEVETLSGLPIGEIFTGQLPTVKALKALVFVLRRRDDSEFTFEAAGKVELGEFVALVGGAADSDDGDADPAPAAA